jgi:ribose-phosphate pyrophosphokinase
MQIIKLSDDKSDFHDLIVYPDGQKSLKLKLDKLKRNIPINVLCRIKKFSEFEILCCLVSALKEAKFEIKKIFFVYLCGMRSDRVFEEGQPNYWQDVIKHTFLFDLEDDATLNIFFPHSNKALDRGDTPENCPLLFKLNLEMPSWAKDAVWIKPDKNETNFPGLPSLSKQRDSSGNIVMHINDDVLEVLESYPNDTPMMIADDLCDGGATFVNAAKILKEHFPKRPLYLFVAHGLFTKGVDYLFEYYDKIICTNSYQDIECSNPNFYQIKIF